MLPIEHSVNLSYQKFGRGPAVFILHGLFGSGDNWRQQAQLLADRFTVYLPDARNHGASPHTACMNYSLMAADLARLIEQCGNSAVSLIGHSMGGKTAMTLALHPHCSIQRLVVVDIAPRAYPPHHQELINALLAIDLEHLESRRDADNQLRSAIPNAALRGFLLKGLKRSNQGFHWNLNLLGIQQTQSELMAAVPIANSFNKPTLFIKGQNSNYIQPQDQISIVRAFPMAQFASIADAGHWPHAQKPMQVHQLLIDFLDDQAVQS